MREWEIEEVGEGMCIRHLGLSDNHLGCDGSGDLSSNSDSVITLNLLVCKYSFRVSVLPDPDL